MKLVKKVVTIFLAIIVFISVIFLTFILNINILTDSQVIKDIAKDLDYLELVDIKGNSSNLKDYYNELYSSLQKNDVSQEMISQIYEMDFFNIVTSSIIYNKIASILDMSNDKYYIRDPYHHFTKEELDILLDEEFNKNGFNDDKILDLMKENNVNIIEIERVVGNGISMVIENNIVRYMLGYPFKIILVCLITISIILLYLMNKEKYLPYIFVPVILSSFLVLVLSLFLKRIITYFVLDSFLLEFVNPFVKIFSNNLLFSSLILLFISAIYLMINEFISNMYKKKIKPKIKIRKYDEDFM